MLEKRTYTYTELIKIGGTTRLDAIKKKLTRKGYKYTFCGRGKDIQLTITELPPTRFKDYCISELGFSPQTDFRKLKKFLYTFFFDEDFQKQPYSEMERRLTKNGVITRQTMSKWVKHLCELNMIFIDFGTFNYFINSRNDEGDIITKPSTKTEYSNAWIMYFDYIDKGKQRDEAFQIMRISVGGVPQKKGVIEENAFEAKRIDTLKEILQEEKEEIE